MSRNYDKTLEISALYEISKLLGSSLNLKSNLRGVMRVLSEYLDMKRGTVALRTDNEVSIIAAHGMSEEEIKREDTSSAKALSAGSQTRFSYCNSEYRRGTAVPEQDGRERNDKKGEYRLSLRTHKIQE